MNLFTMYILDQSRALCSSMGFTVVGTSWCYFFNDTTLTYDMAKANCIDRGMEMPMIESESEWNALLEHIDFKKYWIGGYAIDIGGVREWFWENHQKIGPFRPWADGKPDNTMNELTAIASFQRGWDNALTGSPKYLMCEPKINFE
ncbi:type-2 ice-structuring protein-like [Crassostrea virginica]